MAMTKANADDLVIEDNGNIGPALVPENDGVVYFGDHKETRSDDGLVIEASGDHVTHMMPDMSWALREWSIDDLP